MPEDLGPYLERNVVYVLTGTEECPSFTFMSASVAKNSGVTPSRNLLSWDVGNLADLLRKRPFGHPMIRVVRKEEENA